MESIPGFILLGIIAILIFVVTPKLYDVRLRETDIVVEFLGRWILKRVPLEIVRDVASKRMVVSYLPFPFFGMSWSEGGASFVNRSFRPAVVVRYREPLRRSYIDKTLVITPADPDMFVRQVQQRIATLGSDS